MSKLINEIGNRYGRLTVLEEAGRTNEKTVLWLCKCDCGNFTIKRGHHLRNGLTKSCGCLRKDTARENAKLAHLSQTLSKGTAAFNVLLGGMKNNAKKRHLKWDLSDSKVEELITQPCFYCGALPRKHDGLNKKLNGDFPSNGLDRINSKRGYTEDNVVPCCADCNRAKGRLTISEFIQFIDRISKHLSKMDLI